MLDACFVRVPSWTFYKNGGLTRTQKDVKNIRLKHDVKKLSREIINVILTKG
jgi:hypothetical protein